MSALNTPTRKNEKLKQGDFVLILHGDTREKIKELKSNSIDVIITSPPYWGLKDYGEVGQIGQEPTLEEYLGTLVNIFTECYRILVGDGLFFLNVGDTYFGYWGNKQCGQNLPPSSRGGYNENKRPKFKPEGWKKDKQKALIPFRLAIALQYAGWIVRNDITWNKPNGRPENVNHRLNCLNEYWFLLCKDGRTKRFLKDEEMSSDLWVYSTEKVQGHNATFPLKMIVDILKHCDCKTVLDPFSGAGTTARAAQLLGKEFTGIEINKNFIEISEKFLQGESI